MQEAIEPGPVEKGEINALIPNVIGQSIEVVLFAAIWGADMIWNRAVFEVVEDIWPAIHPAGLERISFLGEIVERNVFEGDIVQIEITSKIELNFDEFGKPAAENAAAGQALGQPAQRTQRFEGGVGGIVNEITPVAMFDRPGA